MKVVFAFVLAGCMLFAPTVGAQSDQERSVARSTAKSGIEAFRDGRFEDAVELLTRAESVIHAPTHLLFIARAQSKLGNLVEAKEAYIKVLNEQLDEKAPAAFVKAQDDARAELEQVQSRLATLKIVVAGAKREDVEVTIDGKPLPNIALGVATEASPGERRLVVSAPGKKTQELTVELGEGAQESVSIELQAAAPGGKNSAPARATSEVEPAPGSSKKTIGYVVGGVGIVGVGVGSAFGFMTLSAAKKARNDDSLCPNEQCSSDGEDAISKAKTKALISNVGVGVGAALIATGAFLVITSPRTGNEVVRLSPHAGSHAAGVSLEGMF